MDRSEFSELSKLEIFNDMTREELEEALSDLHPRRESYTRNQVILPAGDRVEDICVVLAGSVRMESIDRLGDRSIVTYHRPGNVFGLVSGTLGKAMEASAVANEDCRILLLDRSALDAPRSHWRPWLFLMTRNLLTITCRNNEMLAGRGMLLAPKRARDRITAYLNKLYRETGETDFFIPFDQQQLADFLNLDRSVVSKELNKLKREGQLWFSRNHFVLHPGTEITAEAPESGKA